jgi:multidrug resistance protein, MATE family
MNSTIIDEPEQESNSLKIDTSVKTILLLTLPLSLSRLIPEVNYLINAYFLGQLGSKELALAGITGVYYLIFAAIGYGLNNALLAIMSRKAGEEERNEIFSTLWHGIIVSLGLAIIFILGTLLFLRPFLAFAGIESVGADQAAGFLSIRIFGLLALYPMLMQNSYLISLQQTKYLIVIALVESLANVFFDYSLIFGLFGMPALGFNGAAYASILSEIVGLVTVYLLTKWLRISKRYNIKQSFAYSAAKLKLVFVQGLPLMSQLALSCGAWWIFYLLISRNYTYEEQAISQAMRNLFGLTGIFSWAFGSSTNTIISNLIGQGRADEIFYVIRKLTLLSFGGMIIISIGLNLFPTAFLHIFGQGVAFESNGIAPVRVISIALLILCFGVIWLNAVIATGKTKVVFWIEFGSIVAYTIYIFVVVEVLKLSISAAWMSEWVYWSVSLILSTLYLKYGNWKEGLTYY